MSDVAMFCNGEVRGTYGRGRYPRERTRDMIVAMTISTIAIVTWWIQDVEGEREREREKDKNMVIGYICAFPPSV